MRKVWAFYKILIYFCEYFLLNIYFVCDFVLFIFLSYTK